MNKHILPIPGFSNYKISDDGRVFSHYKSGGCGIGKIISDEWIERKTPINKGGYKTVRLCRDGKYFSFLVHRLVLTTFVGECPKGMEGCHKNDIKTDNKLKNLRWDIRLNNCKDKIRNKKQVTGESHHMAKLTEDQVKEIRKLYKQGWGSIAKLAKLFNINSTRTVYCIVANKTWKYLTIT